MNGIHGKLLWAVFVVIVLAGCGTVSNERIRKAVKQPAPTVEEPAFIFHRVMAGETMGSIARHYSGKESMWREIAEANPELSPFKLKKDDIVRVPAAIATVNKEQPSTSTAARKPRKPDRKDAATSAPDDEPDDTLETDFEPVFGPK
ncbi:MAG: LysM peptidoglycan-binding domain-containing protein [Syntrophobacteraceae bacterium]|jgi:LysM repeat protein|nr:LysM peptidoglycan-binding domain-containing protein [Syntrophobacteraceae bacterium]